MRSRFFICLFLTACAVAAFSAEVSESELRFLALEKRYLAWDGAIIGAGNYFKHELFSFLANNINKEITTGYDYAVYIPYSGTRSPWAGKFRCASWLAVVVPIDDGFIADLNKIHPENEWRGEKLVSITGIIRNFALEQNDQAKVVVLYLRKVRVAELVVPHAVR